MTFATINKNALVSFLKVAYAADKEVQLRALFGPTGSHRLFCDMDGVLTDFDKAYLKQSPPGIPPMGKPLDPAIVGEESFWADMDWAPGGEELWRFILPLTPTILTANPSYKGDSSTEEAVKIPCEAGKRKWVLKHIGGATKVVVRRDKASEIIPGKVCVLIDDMDHNLKSWKDAGGTPVMHVRTATTLDQLLSLVEVLK